MSHDNAGCGVTTCFPFLYSYPHVSHPPPLSTPSPCSSSTHMSPSLYSPSPPTCSPFPVFSLLIFCFPTPIFPFLMFLFPTPISPFPMFLFPTPIFLFFPVFLSPITILPFLMSPYHPYIPHVLLPHPCVLLLHTHIPFPMFP